MRLNELEPGQGKINVEAEMTKKEEPREFTKFGKVGRVCKAKIKDESGEITLTLWNDEIDNIDVGDKVKITNGYCNEFQGELQITAGKFGKLEVLKGEQ
ncbi:DNA-binding protein [Candidatus Woesearchaeota archaeon]|nr:DNA-binding protein [Candidatus Woesearchaeota archaeon]